MRVFFGKFSTSNNKFEKQITEKRYYAKKGSSWFNGIKEGDYCYILAGNEVYLWKAQQFEEEYLQFEAIIEDKLPLNSSAFKAFKFFIFNPQIIVLTTRQVRNAAFFKIDCLDIFSEEILKNIDTYYEKNNFRKIIVSDMTIEKNDKDIYLQRDKNKKYTLYPSSFIDDKTLKNFIDNTDKLGKSGKKVSRKDKTISKINTTNINSELKDVSFLSFYDLFFNEYKIEEIEGNNTKEIDIDESGNIKMDNDKKRVQPLNQILFGPPGTGKTYNTINKALEIILEQQEDEEIKDILKKETYTKYERDKLKEKFEEYKKTGQIEFVTFHQSYGYEEFVEGIKAISPDDERNSTDSLIYKVENGIFKKLSNKAKESFKDSKKSIEVLKNEKTLKDKIETFLSDSIENETMFSKKKGGKFKIKDINNDEIFISSDDSNYSNKILVLLVSELFEILDSKIELKTSRQMAKDIFGINNQRQKDTYYLSICKEFNKSTFQDDIIEVFKEPSKNYILIIDEINRGNISKIFGELITLIEDSKRYGKDESVEIVLPYSNKSFSVPQNLYIIGTMNTADRSIAPIDTALRRRFVFEEMPPKPELLTKVDDKIDLEKVLTAINTRIEYLYDRDHTIGHAYLIDVETLDELRFAFKNKILPLLAEYFYEDWANIDMVLNNNGFIQEKSSDSTYLKNINNKYNGKKIYEISDDEKWTSNNFMKIYDDTINLEEKEQEAN